MIKGVISWDEYFMGIALLSARRSKDPNTQVGACIVNNEKRVVAVGYNGFPIGCPDQELPWKSTGEFHEKKYPYVVHAELNAILNASVKLAECSIYTVLFPCNECAKAIIQSGIKNVIYLSDKYFDKPETVASKRMFNMAGISYRQYIDREDTIEIDLRSEKV